MSCVTHGILVFYVTAIITMRGVDTKKVQYIFYVSDSKLVGIPGLEPGMTGPESVVLPLHHIPISKQTDDF